MREDIKFILHTMVLLALMSLMFAVMITASSGVGIGSLPVAFLVVYGVFSLFGILYYCGQLISNKINKLKE